MEPVLPAPVNSTTPSPANSCERLRNHGELTTWWAILVLTAVTVGMLVPFLDKPFHIDDPLFVWAAQHIRSNIDEGRNPADFFGFDVNWNGRIQKMHEVTQNPPLACYLLAASSFVTGWDERGLHAVFLIPALGVVLGTWVLARRLCDRPLLAALAVAWSPIFVVSSTNVMCDTLMTCFWVWAVILWRDGVDRESHWRLALAAVLMALATVTKYFGLCLVPLLILDTVIRSRRPWKQFFWLLIPALTAALYEFWTRRLYGHGMLMGAADYATSYYRQKASQHWSVKPVATFAFTGGSLLCLLVYIPRLCRSLWMSAIGVILASTIAVWLHHRNFYYLRPDTNRPASWDITLQAGILTTLGVGVCILILTDLWKVWRDGRGHRSDQSWRAGLADSVLLAAWTGGTMLFAGFINWSVNGRTLLPLVPAAALLMCRRMDWGCQSHAVRLTRGGSLPQPMKRAWIALFRAPPSDWQCLPLVLVAFLTYLIAQADYRLAWSHRLAADEFATILQRIPGLEIEPGKVVPRKLWFAGHWGFQYYMERNGCQAVGFMGPPLNKGDLLAYPVNNSRQTNPSKENYITLRPLKFDLPPWVATHSRSRRAGFYADRWGPLPFVFGDEWQPDPRVAEETRDIHKDVYYLFEVAHTLRQEGIEPENVRPLDD